MSRYDQLRRETRDLLEETEITDLEDAAAKARERVQAQDRLIAAAEATAENTRRPAPERGKMSIKERVAYVAKHGMDKYLSLPWSAR